MGLFARQMRLIKINHIVLNELTNERIRDLEEEHDDTDDDDTYCYAFATGDVFLE